MLINRRELAIGAGVSCLGLALIFYLIPVAVISPRTTSIAVLDPAFWPNVVAWSMFLLGLSMALSAILDKRGGTSVETDGKFEPNKIFRFIVLAAILSGYYLILPDLGMIWGSSIAYIAIAIFICKTQYRLTAVTVGLLLPASLYAFFYHVAGVDIPQNEFVRLP